MDKNTCKNIVIIILLVFVLLLGYQIIVKKENFTMTEQSNEAVQNIASVYSDTSGTITVNNLTATGNIKPNTIGNSNWNIDQSGNVTISGTLNANTYGKINANTDIITSGNITAKGAGSFINAIATGYIHNTGSDIIDGTLTVQGINILQELKNTTIQLKNLMTFLSPQYNVSTLTWAG